MTKMDRLTITQRIKKIKTYYKNGDSATAMYHALREDCDLHNCPTTQAIGKILKKFKETGVFTNIDRPVQYRFARFVENIAHRHQELGLSYDTLWCILHLDLYLHPYKVQLTQQLNPAEHSQRRRYV